MFRKIIILIFLILLSNIHLSARAIHDFLNIEDVSYNTGIRFPFMISKIPEKAGIANRINRRLQQILFSSEEIINKNNIEQIKQHLYIQNNGVDQAGISSLNYKYQFYPNFLIITIEIDWAGGAYPVGGETDNLHFDLEKGELILMPDLIDGIKYFNFLDKFWLNDCRNSIRQSHQCAYGNETGDYESEKALTLDGKCEFQCHKMNHQFILTNGSIFISNNSKCFPHVWQNCNSGSSKDLKIDDIIEYLSDYGKWLVGLTNNYEDVKPYFHFVGKIDEKYKISMSFFKKEDNSIEGKYFYWKQNKNILLKGKIESDSTKIIINEFVNNSQTGKFELEWDGFLYSTSGFWYVPSNKKKLSVNLMNIYDYRDREYNR